MGQFVSAVGAAEPADDGEDAQAAADRNARGLLAATVTEYVRNVVTGFLKEHQEYPGPAEPLSRQFTNMLASEVAADVLRRSVKQDVWHGPEGKVYVLYRIPRAAVHDEVRERMAYCSGIINPFGADPERAAGQMGEFLQAVLEEQLAASVRARPSTPQTPPQERPPRWLELGRHEGYPAATYVTAIGLGAELDEAELSARQELGARLRADLAATVRALRLAKTESALTLNVEWLDPNPMLLDPGEPVATRVVERWSDPLTDTECALGVLDRIVAARLYRDRALAAYERAGSLAASAQNQAKAGNYAASLKDYLEATAAAREAVLAQLTAMVAAPAESRAQLAEALPEPRLATIKEGLRPLLATLAVERTGGDKQWMPPGAPPPQPFCIRAVTGDPPRGVGGLTFALRTADGTIRGRATTDAQGAARWQMTEPLSARQPCLTAELDLRAIGPGADLFRLTAPSATFDCIVRSRENTQLVVRVIESALPGVTPVSEALATGLRSKGYRLADADLVRRYAQPGQLGPESSDQEVLAAYAPVAAQLGPDAVLLVVFGSAVPRPTETVETAEGTLAISYCPFEVRVLDARLPGADKRVATLSGTGQRAHLGGVAQAERSARSEAAAAAAAQLLQALRSRLGPAGDEPQ
jgi:hypothetical protein